jgi:hypothetical protein
MAELSQTQAALMTTHRVALLILGCKSIHQDETVGDGTSSVVILAGEASRQIMPPADPNDPNSGAARSFCAVPGYSWTGNYSTDNHKCCG